MKQIYLLAVTSLILTSCGSKLYSYRKTVDMNEPNAAVSKNPTSSTKASIHVVPNTSYLASKPIGRKPEPTVHSAGNISSSSMAR
jgi:hypothetical protein